MSDTLAISVHLEHLDSIPSGNPGDVRTKFYFGVNLGTALDNGATPIPSWDPATPLAPRFRRLAVWRWTNLVPRVFVWKKGDPLTSAMPVANAGRKSDFLIDDAAGMKIETYVTSRVQKMPATVKDPFYLDVGATIVNGAEYEPADNQNPQDFFFWPPFIKGVSTLAPEVTDPNFLSHIIEIDEQDFIDAGINLDTDIFAVFVCFDATVDGTALNFPNLPTLLGSALDPEAEFNNAKDFPQKHSFQLNESANRATTIIQPVVLEARASLPTGSAIQDLDSLWINVTVDADGHDQASQTIQNLTRAFDPAQHLVDLLRDVISRGATSGDAFALAQLGTFAIGRELAHSGLGTATSYSLVDDVAAQIPRRAEVRPALQAYEDAKFDSSAHFMAEWPLVLAAAAPQLSGIADRLTKLSNSNELLAALEILTAQISDPEILNAIIVQQWQRAISDPTLWTQVFPALTAALSLKTIRSRFQEQWLQPRVAKLAAALGKPEFDQTAGEELHDELHARLTILTAGDATLPDLLADFRDDLTNPLAPQSGPSRQLLEKLSTQARAAGTTAEDRRAGTEDAQPITIRVDSGHYEGNATTAPAASDDDIQRRVAGVGILLRQKDQEWRCLHIARLGLTSGSDELINANVISPSNLSFVAGQRQTTISYDNEPLAASSLLGRITNTQQQDQPAHAIPWLESRLPLDSQVALDEYLMPSLIFGKAYEAAGFLVTNNGQVPRDLVHGSWNQRKKFPIPGNDLTPKHSEKFTYLRRTRVGAPRLSHEQLDAGQTVKNLAPYPAGVRPLATELFVPGSVEPLVGDKGNPLLLLGRTDYGYRNTFEFRLRRPSTPHKVWERWQRGTPHVDNYGMLRGGLLAVMDNQFDESGQELKVDPSLDDPAVEARLYVTLSQVFPPPVPGTPAQEFLITTAPQTLTVVPPDADWAAFLAALAAEQYVSEKIVIRTIVGATQFDPQTLTFSVNEGEVWRIDAYSVVEKKHFTQEQKFDSFVRSEKAPLSLNASAKQVPSGDASEKFYAFSPWTLVVEAANLPLPSAQELWNALALDFDVSTQVLSVQLDRSKVTPAWATIGSIELQRQRWKWHGRPTSIPEQAIDDDKENVEWEVAAYTLRNDDDHTIELIPLPYEQDQMTGLRTIKTMPLADDTRCLHFRWSLLAWNRYTPKPLQWNTAVASSRKWETCQAADLATLSRWKRILPKCRKPDADPVAPPALKICVPITGSWGDKEDEVVLSPGLLAICHGEWFEKYGLAEQLEAGIRVVKHPDSNLDDWYLQYGADPVLQTHALHKVVKSETQAVEGEDNERIYKLPDKTVRPPLGHITDRLGVPDPRVLNTSFLLRIPTIPAATFAPAMEELPAGWRFLQMRFRRRLRGDLCADGVDRYSAWSPPQWVQLLHSRNALLPSTADQLLGNKDLTIKVGGNKISLLRKNAPLPPPLIYSHRLGKDESNRFAYWLLVTQVILDNARHEGEAYFEVLELDESNQHAGSPSPAFYKYLRQTPKPLPAQGKFRIRFLEVQTRDARGDLQTALRWLRDHDKQPWDVLFPEDGKQDAVARISSISPSLDFDLS